jgi:hypothetical protein
VDGLLRGLKPPPPSGWSCSAAGGKLEFVVPTSGAMGVCLIWGTRRDSFKEDFTSALRDETILCNADPGLRCASPCHPTDEDLSVGTPAMGYFHLLPTGETARGLPHLEHHPTLGAKTKTRRGWGTQICGWDKEVSEGKVGPPDR